MCNKACIEFGQTHLSSEEISGKSVIEVGSLDVNGSLRPFVAELQPASYLGVDLEMGPGVDQICNADDLLERFGPESFDLLISTELLEHTCNWRKVIHNFKQLLKPGGVLLLTTRSKGFALHGYPFDYWRYEIEDMQAIFSDFEIETIQRDPLSPGVYVKAHKPEAFAENNLSDYRLFSIIKGDRALEIMPQDLSSVPAPFQQNARQNQAPLHPPLVSVLIPTYNRPALLKEAVASVLQQTYENFEIIVVNDGGENVSGMLAEFADPRINYLPLEQNRGKAHALNRGIEISRGKYFAYLDDDDHYYPHHLEMLVAELEAHPEIDLVYSDFEEILYLKDAAGQRRETKRMVKYSADFRREALFKENFIPHPTILHRREVFRYSGGFDESCRCLIDWEFLRRLAFYCDFRHVPIVTGEYFINRDQGDHITNLHSDQPNFYQDHYCRIRRQLPPRPWSKVMPVTLLVKVRPEDDELCRFFVKLVLSTHYPCEILVLDTPELGGIEQLAARALPERDWLQRMNIEILPLGASEVDMRSAALHASGDLLVALDTSFSPCHGWLMTVLKHFQANTEASGMSPKPIQLSYHEAPSPWGWAFDRAEFLSGSKFWLPDLSAEKSDPETCQVSIIIPVRNKVQFTQQCLSSIRRTPPTIPHEIIVVDNASDDGTAELLENLAQRGVLTWLRNDPPRPFAASCNRGAAVAKGKYLLFLNNDTLPYPEWLEELFFVAENTPDVGAVGAKLLFPDETIQHAGVAFHDFKQGYRINPYHIFRAFPRQHPSVNKQREFQVVTGACLLTPKSVFAALGSFDERYINCFEDVDYCLLLRSRGYRVIYAPAAELIHFEGQTPGRNDAIHPSRALLQEKWGDQMRADDHLYLTEDGLMIVANDEGLISICEETELSQWREAIRQIFDLKQWLMALEEIDRMEQIVGTHDPDLLEMRGFCALKLGDNERARLALSQAVKSNPDNPNLSWGLVQVALAEEKQTEARSRLRRLLTNFPAHPQTAAWQEALERTTFAPVESYPDALPAEPSL